MGQRTIILILGLSFASPAEAQRGPKLKLEAPTGQLAAEFSQVTSIRELADGRILITDGREGRVMLGDFATGAVTPVGRTGSGPEEYTGTTLLMPVGGDSSIMLDLTRRWILFHQGRIVDALPPDAPVAREARNFIHGADTIGRVMVFRSRPGSSQQRTESTDSLLAILLDRRTARPDTVALLRAVPSETQTIAQGGGTMTVRIFKPFATGETAALFPDGWIAIARLDPYRIDWRSADGRITRGQPLQSVSPQVVEVDRNAFREANPPPRGRPPLFDFGDFPKRLPPFEYRAPGDPALFVAPHGRVVLRRTVAGSQADNTYDIVDRTGSLVGTLAVGKRERVVAFGATSVYIVTRDVDDIQRITRHRWPV
jgi:hypothetical protein